ncbi:hypothetical protein [Leifsonia sp. NPDC080035]|uniref:Uncharacterized protein n=1 Tax=Leifsonia sp. NPDC080035 TaxID=3143936 RepID=A0AAU7GAK6_9MICO
MDDLRGSAAERLAQLDALGAGDVTDEWLRRQLRAALHELAQVEPVADAEAERREDF